MSDKRPEINSAQEAARLRWRHTKGHIFRALGALSLVVALVVIGVLVISTLGEAKRLIPMKTAADVGISFVVGTFHNENQDSGVITNHPYLKQAPLVPGSAISKIGWVEARHVFIAVPEGANRDLVQSYSVEITQIKKEFDTFQRSRGRRGTDFPDLVARYSQDQTTLGTGGDLGVFEFGQSSVDTSENTNFSDVVFTLDLDETRIVRTPQGFHLVQVTDRDLINFIPEGTSIPQLNDEIMRDQSEVWAFVERQRDAKFDVSIHWVPKAEILFGDLERESVFDEAGNRVLGKYYAKLADLPENSLGHTAGLQTGDIIYAVNDLVIQGPSVVDDALAYAAQTSDELIDVKVRRGNEELVFKMALEQSREFEFNRSVWGAIQHFVMSKPSASFPDRGGLLAGIVGTVFVLIVMIVVAFPLGTMAAIYMEEYAKPNFFTEALQILIANLAGIPSIAYGLLAVAIFVNFFQLGISSITGGLTLGLVILPIMIVAAREALRAVPPSIREAAYGVGATRWQVLRHQVLPNSLPGIFTGMILSLAQAIGETAPLLMLGASIFVTFVPESFFDRFTVIPLQIFNWALDPRDGFDTITAAAVITLLVIMILLNVFAIWLRNRVQRSW